MEYILGFANEGCYVIDGSIQEPRLRRHWNLYRSLASTASTQEPFISAWRQMVVTPPSGDPQLENPTFFEPSYGWVTVKIGICRICHGKFQKKPWMFVRTPWPGKIHEHHPSFRRVSQSQKVRDGDLPMWRPQLPWSKEGSQMVIFLIQNGWLLWTRIVALFSKSPICGLSHL